MDQPVDALQYQGAGDDDAVDLMRSIAHRTPLMALNDTLTKRQIIAYMTEPTGDPDQVWTADAVDGRRKFTIAALTSGRFEIRDAQATGITATHHFMVTKDHRLYRAERARIE